MVLFGLFLAHALVNVYWTSNDLTLRSYDAFPHLEAQVHAARVIKAHGLYGLADLVRSPHPGWWPSVRYVPEALLTVAFGEHMQNMRLFMLGYLAVLLTAVYHIGRLLRSRDAGLLAAALVSFMPIVYGEARNYGVDLPGGAMLAASVWALLATRGFTRAGPAVGLALSLGWCLLVRPQMVFFFTPLGVIALVRALASPGEASRRRILVTAVLAALGAAAVSSIWWWGNLESIAATFGRHQSDSDALSGNGDANFPFYLKMLPWAFQPWMLLWFAVSLWGWRTLAAEPRRSRWILLWAWLLGGAAVILTVKVHFIRFLLPICPALAVLTALGLMSLSARRRRLAVVLALAISGGWWLADSTVLRLGAETFLSTRWPGLLPRGDSSGPPREDLMLMSIHRAARQVQGRHGRGHSVRVRLCTTATHPVQQYALRAGPVFSLTLPDAQVEGQPYLQRVLQEETPFIRIGGTIMPPLPSDYRRRTVLYACHGYPPVGNVRVVGPGNAERQLLFQSPVPGTEHWITLWR